ncbi:fluoride efflux transporter CrcB [Psychroflexus aestuariivivens]|uniref:fluoride efflux transporter CrcB n=1 Tax=Psychroflexus aestuariivivens TaxID=1795040 RepID=UPI000FDC4805|nr:fluoride efflux transporter CrcB [Psychroflexus aestuariivivens]
MKSLLLVFLGGGLGSICRYLVTLAFKGMKIQHFPYYQTLTVNILGSFCIGLALGWLLKNNPQNSDLQLLLITGFCGGFTTFSAFSSENLNLLKSGQFMEFALYISVSIVLGLLAVILGFSLGK